MVPQAIRVQIAGRPASIVGPTKVAVFPDRQPAPLTVPISPSDNACLNKATSSMEPPKNCHQRGQHSDPAPMSP